jgi:hypothetical protein
MPTAISQKLRSAASSCLRSRRLMRGAARPLRRGLAGESVRRLTQLLGPLHEARDDRRRDQRRAGSERHQCAAPTEPLDQPGRRRRHDETATLVPT